jgi:oligoendopeptidase F
VEPEVVEALRDAVVAAYPRLSHRYYALKAKWLGLDTLQVWDRNAPLPMEDHPHRRLGRGARDRDGGLCRLRPAMADLAEPFFDKGWIDAGVKPGKAPGAFAHPTVADVHPYVMLNYLGKPRDVMTLAHELGHGVHQVLAAGQGELLSSHAADAGRDRQRLRRDADLPQAAGRAKTDAERKVLLAGKVEDMINTVVRQIAFYDFECKLHAARREGELTPDDINALWMSVQGESLGPAFDLHGRLRDLLGLHPAFRPFALLRLRLCLRRRAGERALRRLRGGRPGSRRSISRCCAAGGSKHHKELLAPFGLDASDPAFWDKGLGMIEGFIDELEAMDRERCRRTPPMTATTRPVPPLRHGAVASPSPRAWPGMPNTSPSPLGTFRAGFAGG